MWSLWWLSAWVSGKQNRRGPLGRGPSVARRVGSGGYRLNSEGEGVRATQWRWGPFFPSKNHYARKQDRRMALGMKPPLGTPENDGKLRSNLKRGIIYLKRTKPSMPWPNRESAMELNIHGFRTNLRQTNKLHSSNDWSSERFLWPCLSKFKNSSVRPAMTQWPFTSRSPWPKNAHNNLLAELIS